MAKEEPKHKQEDKVDDDYIGNMWGWKFSLFSLGLILFSMFVMWTRGDEAFDDVKQEQFWEIQNPHIKKDTIEQ